MINAESSMRMQALYGDRIVPCYQQRPSNLDDMLRQVSLRRGTAPAVEDDSTVLTYAELDRLANRIASGLRAQGVSAGDRVALYAGNHAQFIAMLVGIWRLNAIVVPIGTRQSTPELTYILNQCGAAAIAYDAGLAASLPERAATPTVHTRIRLDDTNDGLIKGEFDYPALLAAGSDAAFCLEFADTDPACIMYTSGTTGRPKGAVLSHLGFFHTARSYELRFGYTADDRMMLVIPGTHISGLLAVIVAMLQVGGCVICQRTFRADETLAQFEARRVTATVMVPAMYNLCLLQADLAQRDLSRWRIGHFGGAAMPDVTIERLAAVLPNLQLYNGFGATETTSAVTLTESGQAASQPDTVGTLLPGVDIRVLDTDGHEVAPGDAGELWIRSPGNAVCYWDNPEASRAAFVAGYWRSGDIGSVDQEGNLRVFDRIKDMINRGGYKIYCVELENVLQRLPGVIEAAAVAAPCPVLGERVHVFLHGSTPLHGDDVRTFCRRELADYKTPDYITFSLDPLPRNLNGKLVKAPLRQRALEEANARALATTLDS